MGKEVSLRTDPTAVCGARGGGVCVGWDEHEGTGDAQVAMGAHCSAHVAVPRTLPFPLRHILYLIVS